MKLILAYVIVIPLVQFCLTLGSVVAGFPIALCLAWAPMKLRVGIAGTLGGIAGVFAAVGFGYLVFFLLPGRESYGLGAFIASTLPLAIPIVNDKMKARQLASAANQLPEGLEEEAAGMTGAPLSAVRGYWIGLILAAVWFIVLRKA